MRSIRAFESGDLLTIQSIRKKAFQAVHDSFRTLLGEVVFQLEFSDWNRKQGEYLESICATNSGKEVYVAIVGGKIVGFLGLSMDPSCKRGEIDLNAVDPEYQGQKVGEFMYRFAVRRMRDAGMKVVKVSTGADASHIQARRAYEKAGFTVFIPSVTLYQTLSD
jgi:ribosomal protein S18 acetylase RimI-like enzyme